MKIKLKVIYCLLTLTYLGFSQKDTIPKFSDLSIDTMGKIKWTVTFFGKGPRYSISIEQFKSNKWIYVCDHILYSAMRPKVTKLGSASKPTSASPEKDVPFTKQIKNDSFTVKFHKGENSFRLKMTRPYNATSGEIKLTSKVSNDDGSIWVSGNYIFLDKTENYEILNSSGDPVLKGEAKTIDIVALAPGSYYFYTKKETRTFVK